MRIGELARRSGVSVRALRYYEEQKLLESTRTPGGQRDYPEGATDRVRLIQQLYAAGLPSRTIVDLLPCVTTGLATQEMLDQIITERDSIVARIAELGQAKEKLDRVIEQVAAAGIVTGAFPAAAAGG
ncbi:MerR family transcriptional regulator [Streptomyces tsukubensis]|uniref:MerR family transcriptional regulator n=1 Tax=Streptomyces tsukubensis TaxID=83656 RepID=A0A1V4A985_9ACTN|nr:MerR family transcriptional regulator [Streptomyces tsukubensis]OON78832.1 MerR family transcriptional regulator [Streptomyces tsukubensis]QFR94308.1 MerR family transcriptional regulator [Streptomyces tsukubensis]